MTKRYKVTTEKQLKEDLKQEVIKLAGKSWVF